MDSAEIALALAIASLGMGPLVAWALERREPMRAALDGFVLVATAGLSLLFLLPHAYLDAGAWAHAPLKGRVDARARLEEAFGQPVVDDVSGQLWALPTRGLDGTPPSFGPLRNEGPPGPPP